MTERERDQANFVAYGCLRADLRRPLYLVVQALERAGFQPCLHLTASRVRIEQEDRGDRGQYVLALVKALMAEGLADAPDVAHSRRVSEELRQMARDAEREYQARRKEG